MYVWVIYTLHQQKAAMFYQREGEEQERERWRKSMLLTKYPLIFIVLWIFPLINRIENS